MSPERAHRGVILAPDKFKSVRSSRPEEVEFDGDRFRTAIPRVIWSLGGGLTMRIPVDMAEERGAPGKARESLAEAAA